MSIDKSKRKTTNKPVIINTMTLGKEFDKFKEEYKKGLHVSDYNKFKLPLELQGENTVSIKAEKGGKEEIEKLSERE